jgi:carboxynorspermidine decarboxylase
MNSVLPASSTQEETPFFVYEQSKIIRNLTALQDAVPCSFATVLYSLKACSVLGVLQAMATRVGGFSTSSLFEARIADLVAPQGVSIHYTSPGLEARVTPNLAELCTHITLNTTSQLDRLARFLPSNISLGMRINPGWSNVKDTRYDPCRTFSKLGIPLREIALFMGEARNRRIKGVHVHNACLSESWTPLLKTVRRIAVKLDACLGELEWINIGGGYVWNERTDFGPLQEALDLLGVRHGLQVFLEPGAGIVNSAGHLVASVVDILMSKGKNVAILDTTVNHLPEVFEYQYEPDVVEHVDRGRHVYVLAGCSCLAGDVFGEYSFEEPLEIGSRVTFENVGAYSLVKAHSFNGINLPSVYMSNQHHELELIKQFTFDDFSNRCGFLSNEYANL